MAEEELTIADVVIEAMPFSDELINWCLQYPEFKEALKVSNPDRFIALGLIQPTTPTLYPDDKVLGFTVYDYIAERFKQDYIIDLGSRHEEFMLYSKLPSKNYGKYVQPIRSFFAKYGANGEYKDTHHPTLMQIEALGSKELSGRAQRSIDTGKQIRESGRRALSQDDLKKALQSIRSAKQKLQPRGPGSK